MRERLFLYIDRDSPLHRLNPFTKLVLTFALILIAFLGPGYYLATAIFILVLIPLSFWGRIWPSLRLLLPFFGFLFVMQSLFYPGGQTVLVNLWIFSVKAEGVGFAYLTATRILVVVASFLVFLLSTHPSTLMTDLARRGLPSPLIYVIVSTLQIIPQMRVKAETIIDAQRSRGLDTQGSLRKRVRALLPLVGPLVFSSLVDVEERAIAIEARAFSAKRPKTSLVEVPDSRAQMIARWVFVGIVLLAIGSRIWL